MAFPFQVAWGWMHGKTFRTREEICPSYGHSKRGGSPIPPGTLVKVTMVSRLGDVGISTDLNAEKGYTHRASPYELGRIGEETYNFVFDPDQDELMQNDMFRSCYAESIVEWTPQVLDPSWWYEYR